MSDVLALSPDSVTAIEVRYFDKSSEYGTEIISKDKAKDFLTNYLKSDIRSGKLGKVNLFENEKRKFDLSITIRYDDGKTSTFPKDLDSELIVYPGEDSEKTLAFLKSMGIDPSFEYQDINAIPTYKD